MSAGIIEMASTGTREEDGKSQAAPERPELAGLDIGVFEFGHLVAERLDLRPELVDADFVGVEHDGRAVGRQVDVGPFDTFEATETPADAGRAACAGHPLDRQVDPGAHALHSIPPYPMINPWPATPSPRTTT